MTSPRPTRVLFVHHGGEIGGAPISMLQLAAALDRDQFEPQVVFTQDGPVLAVAEKMDIHARVVSMPSVFFYGAHVPLGMRSLLSFAVQYRRTVAAAKELVRQVNPDLVHLNTSVLVPVAAGVKQAGVPLVWHVREVAGPNPLLRRWHTGRIKSLSDLIITNSHYVAGDYVGPTPVEVIHNALDRARFTPAHDGARARVRAELGIPDQSPVAGMIGSVQRVKGHYSLVEVALSVVRSIPSVRFLIVAPGGHNGAASSLKGRVRRLLGMPQDNLHRMRNLVQRAGLEEHFVFSGFRSDIPEVLSAMDVLVFPSLIPEGFGRPLIEAMAMCCPVVTTDIGPTREIVGEGAGILVRPGDMKALASALVGVLKNPELAGRLASAGRSRFLEKFEMEPMRAKIESVYDRLLGGADNRPLQADPLVQTRRG